MNHILPAITAIALLCCVFLGHWITLHSQQNVPQSTCIPSIYQQEIPQ